MTYNRPRSYEDVHRAYVVGQQTGEGVGSLIGVLVGLWIQHHRAVRAQASDLRTQLIDYHQAQDDALQSQLDMESEDERLCETLASFDKANSEHWTQGAQYSREMKSKIESIREQTKLVDALELKERSLNALRQVIDDPQQGVKWRVDFQRKWAAQVYVIHEFLLARVGAYSAKPSETSTTPASSLASNEAVAKESAATVIVERTTANAEVYLDGAFVGNTPAVLHPSSGNHVVRLIAGKDAWERTLTVSDGADLRLRPTF